MGRRFKFCSRNSRMFTGLPGQQACSTLTPRIPSRTKIGSCVSIQMVRLLVPLVFLNADNRLRCFDFFPARIPILIDNTQTPPFVVMESLAELLYLQETVDKDNVFGFDNKVEQSEAVQWLFFWAAGQPMQSQNNYFSRSAPKKLPCELYSNLTL
jgi:hypothetical protein